MRKEAWLYAGTIFLSAFLLFLVQPILGRMILPWFGGGSAVWTTCMLFFQSVLLLGYVYANLVQRLPRNVQFWLHLGLILMAMACLPLKVDSSWKPVTPAMPALHILGALTVSVGLPYFVLSTTGPLVQSWFARSQTGAYRLYALSNLGSMLALMGYPFGVEPFLGLKAQGWVWSYGFLAFGLLCALAASRARLHVPPVKPAQTIGPGRSVRSQWLWVALPACATVLLLGVTAHLTSDVAPIPLLWILPLAIYLLSFILTFDGNPWYRRSRFLLPWVIMTIAAFQLSQAPSFPILALVVVFLAALFLGCMMLHGELASLKPDESELTKFYLLISLGGCLGGLFVALIAPLIFRFNAELLLGLGLPLLLVLYLVEKDHTMKGKPELWKWRLLLAAGCGFWFVAHAGKIQAVRSSIVACRDFYGSLRIFEGGNPLQRIMAHGSTNHGAQFRDAVRRNEPTTYFSPYGGGGMALKAAASGRPAPLSIGIIGLGVGSLSAYGRSGDRVRYYELNPKVEKLARECFSFLSDSKANVEVVLGDARVSMEFEAPQNYNVLVVDAFTGDSIPVHLLTEEAFRLYGRHLASDAVLCVHISNNHLDLRSVVQAGMGRLGMEARIVRGKSDPAMGITASWWVLGTTQSSFWEKVPEATALGTKPSLWTDDYSTIISAFHL